MAGSVQTVRPHRRFAFDFAAPEHPTSTAGVLLRCGVWVSGLGSRVSGLEGLGFGVEGRNRPEAKDEDGYDDNDCG
eukprot:2623283-Rhodomonas_salina.4